MSNGLGVHGLVSLPPGEHQSAVEKSGFKRRHLGLIEVRVGDVAAKPI